MGAGSEQGAGGSAGINDLIVISTEVIEKKAGNLADTCTSLNDGEKPARAAIESLKALNSSSDNCFSKDLQDLCNAEAKFFKNLGHLQSSAYALRNIGITYDNAEQTIAGGETRDLVWPDGKPPGSSDSGGGGGTSGGGGGSSPGSSDSGGGSGGSGSSGGGSNSSSPEWKWNKRTGGQKMEDAEWYDKPFDIKGKLQIGQKEKINYPEKGSYSNQETFAWSVGLNVGSYGEKKNPLEYKDDAGKKQSYGEYKTRTVGDDKFAPTKCGTIAEIYAEYACSWTLAGAQTTKATDNYSYMAEAYVLRAEAKVHAGVGAFLYKTPDGRTVPAYGLSAQAGASFTLAGASASGDYGSVYGGVMGSASAVVGQVYANANATVGMVDGKFVAVASGAVGADAFKATVSGGARLLGIEVQGSASFKVGVSAKFEVGFDGGKFKANIGAALGIGFELSINIDFSKAISIVKDVGKAVVEGVKTVGRAIGRAAEAVGRWFRRW